MSQPTSAYDLLEERERHVVDDYVLYVIQEQEKRRERIALALNYPIPQEYMKRSRGVLAKPLARAALAERIKHLADQQDLNPARVVHEHAQIAFANLHDFLEPQPFGDYALKNIKEIPYEKMAAVKAIRTKPTMNGMHTEIVMHDKLSSLKALGELMGLVAPDKQPVLEEYAKPQVSEGEQSNLPVAAPAETYAQMLEKL